MVGPLPYNVGNMKPPLMLAKKVTMADLKDWSQITWERHYIEPKIDGERFVRTIGGDWLSRQGKMKFNVGGLCEAVDKVRRYRGCIIDGELFGGNWSDTISAAHSHDPTGIKLEYRIFDVIDPENMHQPLRERKLAVQRLVNEASGYNKNIVSVMPAEASSFDAFMDLFRLYCAEGCDGAMIKPKTGPYEAKRSKYWLKIKPHLEIDCKIVGFNPGKGKYEDTLGSIEVKVPVTPKEGHWSKHTTSVSGMTDELRDKIWRERKQLMGKIVEVRYRKISDKVRLVEPRLVRIRVDK